MLTLVSLLAVLGPQELQLYKPVPMRDNGITSQQDKKQLEAMRRDLASWFGNLDLEAARRGPAEVRRYLANQSQLLDYMIRVNESLSKIYREEWDSATARWCENNIRAIRSTQELFAAVKDKPTPEQEAHWAELRKQIRSKPPVAKSYMPEALKPVLLFLRKVADEIRRNEARRSL